MKTQNYGGPNRRRPSKTYIASMFALKKSSGSAHLIKDYSHSVKWKKGNTIWSSIYDIFEEIVGSLVPGAYFCIFVAINLFIFGAITDNETNFSTIAFVVISYIIGTAFRRSENKIPDKKSAEYIFYKQQITVGQDNSYAFHSKISIDDIDCYLSWFNNNPYLDEKDRIWMVNKIKRKIKYKKLSSISKKNNSLKNTEKMLRKWRTCIRKRFLFKIKDHSGETVSEIVKFQKYLNNLLDLDVEYPYINIRRYLTDRGLVHLADMIKWDGTSDANKRSKMLIGIMKATLHTSIPEGFGHVAKEEAHIRFSNSMWHVVSFLQIACILFTVFGLGSFLMYIIGAKLSFIPIIGPLSSTYVELCKKIWPSIDFARHITTSIVGILYLLINYKIRHTILNNFHYQRVREIVTILQTVYDAKQVDFQQEFSYLDKM